MYKEIPKDAYSLEVYHISTCDYIPPNNCKTIVNVWAITTNNIREYLFEKVCASQNEAIYELDKAYQHYNIPKPANPQDYLRKIGRKVIVPYFDCVKQAMTWLGQQDNIHFIGQTVGSPGTFMFPTLENVPQDIRTEFPVCESFQMQFSLGVALTGKTVVSVFPRQNFLLLATADMVNMVDKMPAISDNRVLPHIIIRTSIGPSRPVHAGHQHCNDFTEAFKKMFNWIRVRSIDDASQAMSVYQEAYNYKGATLVIENGNMYNESK